MKNIILSAAIFGCIFAQPSLAIFEDQNMQGPPHFQTRTKTISIEEAKKIINDGQITTPLGTYKLRKDVADEFNSEMNQGLNIKDNSMEISETIWGGVRPEVSIFYLTPLEQVPLGQDPLQRHTLIFRKD